MTSFTIHIPDEFVQQAKLKGVFNEVLLKELASQFLTAKLLESLLQPTEISHQNLTWQDYFVQRDLSVIPDEFMNERKQPELQHRPLFDEI